MKNTKKYGFSLAELMIAMLVISVALAAAAPSVTKVLTGGDIIWKTSTSFNEDTNNFEQAVGQIYFEGPNVIVGAQRLSILRNMKEYFKDAADLSGFHFSPKTDKLVIFNNIANSDNANSFMTSSHLSFYNKEAGQDIYAGRLAADRYNLALGKGTLQSLVSSTSQGKYNTAIGQYALLTNANGSYNTALGYKALQGTPATNSKATSHASNSIAIGDNALRNNVGTNNIAIGSYAGAYLEGDNNLVIGNGAGYRLTGSNNLLINPTVGFDPDAKNNNVKDLLRGHREENSYPYITDDDNFSIGVLDYRTFVDNKNNYRPPVIQGFTNTKICTTSGGGCADGVLHAKGLIINTNRFNIKGRKKVEDSWDKKDLELKNIFSVETNVADDDAITLYSTSASLPCNGAAVCLSKFNIATASHFSSTNVDKGIAGNEYNRTKTFPNYNIPSNRTMFPDMPIYDLFLGSFQVDNAYLQNENNRLSEVNKSAQHSGNAIYIIDAGQARHNDALANAINIQPESTPSLLDNKKSLKIRTVKMAMNFHEEFKETSGAIDYLRSNFKDFIKCLIAREDEFACLNTGNTSNEKSFAQKFLSPEMRCEYVKDNNFLSELFGCSDARLKNISGDNLAGLDKINRLNVVNYTYKADKTKTPHVGVIAQELKTVFPNAVKKGSDGYYRIRHEDMFYAMVNSIQELTDRKNTLKALTVDYIDKSILKSQNVDIKIQNEMIKKKNLEIKRRLAELK